VSLCWLLEGLRARLPQTPTLGWRSPRAVGRGRKPNNNNNNYYYYCYYYYFQKKQSGFSDGCYKVVCPSLPLEGLRIPPQTSHPGGGSPRAVGRGRKSNGIIIIIIIIIKEKQSGFSDGCYRVARPSPLLEGLRALPPLRPPTLGWGSPHTVGARERTRVIIIIVIIIIIIIIIKHCGFSDGCSRVVRPSPPAVGAASCCHRRGTCLCPWGVTLRHRGPAPGYSGPPPGGL